MKSTTTETHLMLYCHYCRKMIAPALDFYLFCKGIYPVRCTSCGYLQQAHEPMPKEARSARALKGVSNA